jgi:hypothetical protein
MRNGNRRKIAIVGEWKSPEWQPRGCAAHAHGNNRRIATATFSDFRGTFSASGVST